MIDLKNTTNVIVGGTSGIGAAVGEMLKSKGALVVNASRKTGLDVTDEGSISQFFESVKKEYGTIDNIIFTAGSAAPSGTVSSLDLSVAKTGFDTKFWGSFAVAKIGVQYLAKNGSIILTSGFLARATIPGTFVKTVMNAGIEAMIRILAKEYAPVRVNAVSPGLTNTEAYANMDSTSRAAMLDSTAKSLPVGQVANAQDLAAGYIFLLESDVITASVVDINGGSFIK